ncbi:MAG: hypothetical protein ACREE6_17225, partial [Limisphaerales bacterium]
MILRFIILAFGLAALPVLAKETQFSTAEWHPVDLQKIMAAAAEITPARYPNCDSALVEQHSV